MSQPIPSSAPPRIFVSHSHEDTAFCREFVAGLRAHQLDVWYDEHNLGWGMLHQEISRQLDSRDCFIVILSPAAVASRWVNREIGAALDLEAEGHITSFIIVVGAPCDIPALLRGYRRIQAPTNGLLTASEAAERAFRAVLSEHTNIHAATPTASAEPAVSANAPSASDSGVVEPPPPERKPPSIIAPSDAAQSDLPAAAPTAPSRAEATQQPKPSTPLDSPATREPSPASPDVLTETSSPRPPLFIPASIKFRRDPNAAASLEKMTPEQRQELAAHIRQSASPPQPSFEQADTRKQPSRQNLPIPSAPITMPPDGFPDRLAQLGFVPHRGSDLTTILVPIPNEDMKGRLIGREGRNLRAFEETTGVTLTIDDTPLAVTLSSADPIRRQIALLALIKLVTNGRINPVSIEDATSKARQEVWSKTKESLDGEYILPPLCPVPAGKFQMGSDPKCDPDAQPDEPLHTVNVPAFQIARYPVTVAEYACFVRAGHGHPQSIRAEAGGVVDWRTQLSRLDHPVTCVTWHDATTYATWLARLSGQPWRLPSEEEWEKAARWDSQTQRSRIYPWGDTFDTSRSNTDESNIGTTTPVGQYSTVGASPYHAEDMAGNVWEWTATSYKSLERILRGGSWYDGLHDARTASRDTNMPGYFDEDVGFRLVLAATNS